MDNEKILGRVRVRISKEETEDGILAEYIHTISDRLCLRIGEKDLPEVFESICVDATVKMFRRTYYEGISTEGVANISTSFVEDILAEYDKEINDWKIQRSNIGGNSSGRVVKFL